MLCPSSCIPGTAPHRPPPLALMGDSDPLQLSQSERSLETRSALSPQVILLEQSLKSTRLDNP